MDQGNKRGPMSRFIHQLINFTQMSEYWFTITIIHQKQWFDPGKYTKLNFRFDFDTQEEYANYKSQQEAMPKVGVWIKSTLLELTQSYSEEPHNILQKTQKIIFRILPQSFAENSHYHFLKTHKIFLRKSILHNHFQAAYQYGMKVSDGRKTKGKIGQKNEKAKLDKEWNKVNPSL